MGAENSTGRYCPICERSMEDGICPTDGVQTVALSVVEPGATNLEAGTVLGGRYRIEGLIGKGAMGAVYLAVQLSMRRKVALKVLTREVMREGKELKRFYQEAQAASQLKHPNVVGIVDFGVDDEQETPFIVMEMIEGRSLREVIKSESPMTVARACGLSSQIARALAAAHTHGIVHRDLKPDNIMVSALPSGEEHITVLDFGIAKVLSAHGGAEMTASGVVVGTPRYMSPEQVQGDPVDGRTDLYALGCILHELVTGRPPYTADDVGQLMFKHTNAIVPPLPEDDFAIPPALGQLHDALLAKLPDDRPGSASEVNAIFTALSVGQDVALVDAWSEPPPPPPPPTADDSSAGLASTWVRDSGEAGAPEAAAMSTASAAASGVGLHPPASGGSKRLGGVIIAALLLAVAVGLGIVANRETSPEPTPPVAPPAQTVAVETPPPPPAPPPPKTMVTKQLTSLPTGAEVSIDGRVVGQTPLEIEVPKDGVELTITRRGHRSVTQRIAQDGPSAVKIELRRRAPPPPRKSAPALAPR